MKGGAWRRVEQRPFKGVQGHAPLNYTFNFLQSRCKIDVTFAAVDLCSGVDCA